MPLPTARPISVAHPAGYLRDQTFKNCGYIGNYRGIVDNPAFDPTNPLYPEYACVLPTFTNGVLTGLAPSYVVGTDGKAFNLDYKGDLVADGTGIAHVQRYLFCGRDRLDFTQNRTCPI